MKLFKNSFVILFAIIMSISLFSEDSEAANTYSISCTNDAYGIQHGTEYITHSYVKVQTSDGVYQDTADWTNNGNYVGRDCLYSGAAKTNGTAVVAGEVARNAVNTIVGSVSSRINRAFAAADTATGTGLSFTNYKDGLGLSANKILGGLSLWGDFSSSDFENTQGFASVRADSNRFDGDSNSFSMGVDKVFGKMLVGLVVSRYEADITTTFNSGTYDQDIDTYGAYIAYRTSRIMLDVGFGTGDSSINTARRDLGNDKSITGSTDGDVSYQHARVQMMWNKGRFSVVPRLAYMNMEVDIDAFTETVPNDDTGSAIFGTSNETLTTQNQSVAGRSGDATVSEIGLNISGSWGRFVPFIDLAWQSESTTSAVYETESAVDAQTELSATDASSSGRISGGINFSLGSMISGGISAGTVTGRDESDETYASGGLTLSF